MPEIQETILAPSFDGGEWIRQGPIDLKQLRGKALLVDFWDYTCVNCIRTLPYVTGWYRRYAGKGLQVVGVHAPEFTFARERPNVIAAIEQFGIEYPVVLDNGYNIMRAYSNRFWPAKYLIDAQRRIRYYHRGEGFYQETEEQIQRVLRELNPSADFPPPLEPIRDSDKPGALCYRVTPELYLGFARGEFGNPGGVVREQTADYADPGRHAEGATYLGGRWKVGPESSCAEAPGATIAIRYTAMDVNLVLAPPEGKSVHIELAASDGQRPGQDVKLVEGRSIVTVDRPRMYSLVANESVMTGGLEITALDPGVSAYAFTFISCVVG